MERDLGIPAKIAVIAVLFYFFFMGKWIEAVMGSSASRTNATLERILDTVPFFFIAYMLINIGIGTMLVGMRHFSLGTIQKLVLVNCVLDAFFFAGLTLITD